MAANGGPDDYGPFQRVLLKLSGEALKGASENVLDNLALTTIARQVASVAASGVEVAVVVGGGNIWRGATASQSGMDRATADYAGMLATLINGLALQDALEQAGAVVRTQSALPVPPVAEQFIRRRAIRHLEKGRVVIFAGGTGNPYMTSDTAGSLRAIEIGAQVLLMAKNGVDGVYDADPSKVPGARKFARLGYGDALARRLAVMDSTALTLCMENDLPIIVFDLAGERGIERVVAGERIGTLVCSRESILAGDSQQVA